LHAKVDDDAILVARHLDGSNISLRCQPPNCSNFNVLDLGFFRAIEAKQLCEALGMIDELIEVVENAYSKFDTFKILCLFLSL